MNIKKKITAALLSAVLAAGLFVSPANDHSAGISVTAIAAAASAPKSSAKSGSYNVSAGKKITLSCTDKNAKIYYSVNGGKYKRYSSPIKLTKNTALKLYSVSGGEKSKVVTYNYKLTPKITASVKSGSYDAPQTVKLSTKLSGVKMYYTLDGSKPTKSSARYSGDGIAVAESLTLRVLAVKSGFTGKYYTFKYEIAPRAVYAEDYTQKYYYNAVSPRLQGAYADIYECLNAHKESVDLSKYDLTPDELCNLWWLFGYDNAHFFRVDTTASQWTYYKNDKVEDFCPKYYFSSAAEEENTLKSITSSISDIVSGLPAEMNDPDYETALYLHDALAERIVYDATDEFPQCGIIGPFTDGRSQCQGTAMAYMLLCQAADIPCIIVAGRYGDIEHAWNRVKINGDWYNVDITADDGDGFYIHDFFCFTDAQAKLFGYTVDKELPLDKAAAVSTKYNYHRMQGQTLHSDARTAYEALLKDAAENYAKGEYRTSVYCEPEIVGAVYDMIEKNIIDDLNERVDNFSLVYMNAYNWKAEIIIEL